MSSILLNEAALGGILISLISLIIGRAVGLKGKISEKECEIRQKSCSKVVHLELQIIKEDQKEMKADIKKLLARSS